MGTDKDAEDHFRSSYELNPYEDSFHNLRAALTKQNKIGNLKALFEKEMSREFSLENLNKYDNLLKTHFAEEWEKVENPLKIFTLNKAWTDLFVAWADLPPWHRMKFPEVASLLKMIARDRLYILQNENTIFTEMTVKVIHSFLYTL